VLKQIRIERLACIRSIIVRSIDFIKLLLTNTLPILTNHQLFIKKTFLYTIPENYDQYYKFNSELNSISLLYIICSITTCQWYIGETSKNLIQRMTGHINSVCQFMHDKSKNKICTLKNKRLYKAWSQIGLRDFVIIPIEVKYNDRIENRKLREKKLIKLYKPTLNTQHLYDILTSKHHLQRKIPRPLMHRQGKIKKPKFIRQQIRYNDSTLSHFTSYFTSHLVEYNDLNSLLKYATPGTIMSVYRIPGRSDLTYTNLIKRKYRNCIITTPTLYAGLNVHSFIQQIKYIKYEIHFKIWIGINIRDESLTNTNNKLNCLKRIVAHPHALKKTKRIRYFSPSQLISLRVATQHIQLNKQRSIANSRLYDMLMKAYNINYNTYLTIRIPYSPYVNKRYIKCVILDHVKCLQLPNAYIQKLIQRLRIVLTKSKSIGEILINNIHVAKNYNSDLIPICICKNNIDNCHVKFRPEDFSIYSLEHKVFSQNNKNIPTPTRDVAKKDIRTSIQNYASQIRKMTDYKISNHSQNHMCKLIFTDILDSIRKYCKQTCLPKYTTDHVIDNDVYKTKKVLKGYVISSLDKNNGQCLVSCPLDYHTTLTKAFVNDDHYLHITNKSSINIIEQFRKEFSRRRYPLSQSWYKLCNWYRFGKLPYAYINYKHKDTNKFRPIMSFAQHPMRSLYKLGGKALTFFINQIPNQYSHFNLFNATHVKSFINNTNQQFSTLDVDSIHPFLVDIKNMYTEIKHESIMKAVYWCIGICTNSRNRERIAICKNKHKSKYPTHWGRSYNSHTHTEITIKTIIDIIEYDMNNVIFTLGNIFLRQINGIPMGGFISAPEAQLVCIYSEVQFHLSIGSDRHYISGSRYMDDLSIFIAYKNRNNKSMKRVATIIHKLYDTYDKSLELELQTPQQDGTFTYLESVLKINNNTISMEPYQKNWNHIFNNNKQHLYKLQHFHSYSPSTTKLAMIIGTLYRLDNNSLDDDILFKSIFKLWKELQTLQYPKKYMLKALQSKYNTTNDYKWIHFKKRLDNMPPNMLLAQL
jgi:hypothetical protein